MRFLFLVLGGVVFMAASARAKSDFEIGGNADFFYAYNDVANPYENLQKNNVLQAAGNLNAAYSYFFSDDYSATVFLDLMAASDKEVQNFNNGSWGKQLSADLNTPFGTLSVGETFNAAAVLSVGAPSVSPIKLNNSDIVDFIANPNWQRRKGVQTSFKTLNSTEINTDGVAPKVSYFTPEIYNSTLGFSYVPDTENRRGLVSSNAAYDRDDAYVLGLYHQNNFGPVQAELSLGYGLYHKNDNDLSAGLLLSYGNWSVGGSFRKTYVDGNDFEISREDSSLGLFDSYREGQAWNAGIGYQFGPIKSSLGYFESQADNSANKDQIWLLANDFQVNKYAHVYALAAHVNFRGEDPALEKNRKGYAFALGIGLSF